MNINTNIDVFIPNQKEDKSMGKSKEIKVNGLNQPPKNNKTVIKDIKII